MKEKRVRVRYATGEADVFVLRWNPKESAQSRQRKSKQVYKKLKNFKHTGWYEVLLKEEKYQ